ncbi:hypothetical protein MRX96_013005 [Rhipicephalus microplus]
MRASSLAPSAAEVLFLRERPWTQDGTCIHYGRSPATVCSRGAATCVLNWGFGAGGERDPRAGSARLRDGSEGDLESKRYKIRSFPLMCFRCSSVRPGSGFERHVTVRSVSGGLYFARCFSSLRSALRVPCRLRTPFPLRSLWNAQFFFSCAYYYFTLFSGSQYIETVSRAIWTLTAEDAREKAWLLSESHYTRP